MKQLFFLFGSVLLFACNVSDKKVTSETGQSTVAPVKDSARYTTVQWLDSTTQNLGNLGKGQVAEISWTFKNTGDQPLVIEDVRPACGCTVADKPTEPIAPGGQGVIKAKYNSEGNTGHVSKQMTVLANIKNHNNGNDTQLAFTADVKE